MPQRSVAVTYVIHMYVVVLPITDLSTLLYLRRGVNRLAPSSLATLRTRSSASKFHYSHSRDASQGAVIPQSAQRSNPTAPTQPSQL